MLKLRRNPSSRRGAGLRPPVDKEHRMPKGRIVVDVERCKGCALCTTACPSTLIQMDTHSLNGHGYHPASLVDPDSQCTGCGLCAVVCPEACLSVFRVRVPRGRPALAGVH
jgi:2-oxoglutarate ferredoxin oxidoreductase subunit delta